MLLLLLLLLLLRVCLLLLLLLLLLGLLLLAWLRQWQHLDHTLQVRLIAAAAAIRAAQSSSCSLQQECLHLLQQLAHTFRLASACTTGLLMWARWLRTRRAMASRGCCISASCVRPR
jgi:hypothetical protein